MFELTRSEADERRAVQATVEFSDYLRALVRERRARPPGRPPERARAGRGGRRPPVGGRADRDRDPPPQRGPRGVRERGRQRLVDALPSPGGAGGAARGSGPRADRRRGAAPLRHACPDVRALGPGGHRAARRHGSPGARSWPSCSPRPTGIRPSSPSPDESRPGPRSEPAPLVRGRDPLLPGGAARPPGAGDPVPGDPGADARPWSSSPSRPGSRASSCVGSRRCPSASPEAQSRSGYRPSSIAASTIARMFSGGTSSMIVWTAASR